MRELLHIIESQQFSRKWLEMFFKKVELTKRGGVGLLKPKIMATLFYEPSTRTRLSFESAMIRLGGSTISTENAHEFSSAIKGENLEDTIRVIESYADIIVVRHHEEGSAARAASVSSVPVINAGDGPGQHPTQALLDLYTIWRELDTIDGLSVALVGDLANGRAARSLAYLLAKFDTKILYLVSPKPARMKSDIKEYFMRHNTRFEETADLNAVAGKADVIYQTRVQSERYTNKQDMALITRERPIIDVPTLALMKKRSIILHPLPRNDEIAPEIDSDPRAAYFRQAHNGLFIRMALLDMVLS